MISSCCVLSHIEGDFQLKDFYATANGTLMSTKLIAYYFTQHKSLYPFLCLKNVCEIISNKPMNLKETLVS